MSSFFFLLIFHLILISWCFANASILSLLTVGEIHCYGFSPQYRAMIFKVPVIMSLGFHPPHLCTHWSFCLECLSSLSLTCRFQVSLLMSFVGLMCFFCIFYPCFCDSRDSNLSHITIIWLPVSLSPRRLSERIALCSFQCLSAWKRVSHKECSKTDSISEWMRNLRNFILSITIYKRIPFTGKLCVNVLSFYNKNSLKALSQMNSILLTLLFWNIDLM